MFRTSILGDFFKHLPRREIRGLARAHGSDRYVKSFTTWDHLVAMVVAQLSGCTSLRDLESVFNGHGSHPYHLHTHEVRRSTLSDANSRRDYAVFEQICKLLIDRQDRQKSDLKQVITVLDSSPILLLGKGFEWAEASTSRAYNAGLKLHAWVLPDTGTLERIEITDMNIQDIKVAHKMPLEPDRIYVFDKGYCDYNWWKDITDAGSVFVTRLKRNAAYRVIGTNEIGPEDQILADQIIELTNKHPRPGKTNTLAGHPLRLIQIPHPGGKNRPFLIVTNDLTRPATDISRLYKDRWSIEMVFKWLKQNLKIKRFMGTSRNAVLIQIFTAIIAYLLLRAHKKLFSNTTSFRLKDLLTLARTSLFTRPKPKKPKPKYSNQQLHLWQLS